MTIPTLDQNDVLTLRLSELNQYKIDLGLERLTTVLKRLNLLTTNQQIITVGGTNGKGSTVSALCSLLKTQAKKFGAFTSPHIFRFNERININGVEATDEEISAAFDVIDQTKQDIQLSYFEYAFLAALIIFKSHAVDVIVLEVGLGGRLDATNAVNADVAIITTVDIDHTEWLGDDIESIAYEKAGIMRTGKPVIYGDLNMPDAILKQAQAISAKLLQFSHDYHITYNHSHFTYSYQSHELNSLLRPALKGDWQLKNFSNALTALFELGFDFDFNEIQHSIDQWQIKGRLQTIQSEPQVLVDVAHNKQAISQLVNWLRDNPVKGNTRAVFSVLGDKHLDSWLGLLDEVIDHWFVFQLKNQRALEIKPLKFKLADHVSMFSVFNTGPEAYTMAHVCSESDDRIVVFGSFHVLDEVFEHSLI